MRDFRGEVNLVANTPFNLLAELTALGLPTSLADEVIITARANDIRIGTTSAGAATGKIVPTLTTHTERAASPRAIDLTQFFLHSTVNTTVGIDIRGR